MTTIMQFDHKYIYVNNLQLGPIWTSTSPKMHMPPRTTSCPNKSKLIPNTFKAYIQAQKNHLQWQTFPHSHPKQILHVLRHLIHLYPTLKWKIQEEITTIKAKKQIQLLSASPANLRQQQNKDSKCNVKTQFRLRLLRKPLLQAMYLDK